MKTTRIISVLGACPIVPASLLALILTSALLTAPERALAQGVCDSNGFSEVIDGFPGEVLANFFAQAGKVFTGAVGDSATAMVAIESGHQIFITLTVLGQTGDVYTVRVSFFVTGCAVAPTLSRSNVVVLVGLLLAVAGVGLRRGDPSRRGRPSVPAVRR